LNNTITMFMVIIIIIIVLVSIMYLVYKSNLQNKKIKKVKKIEKRIEMWENPLISEITDYEVVINILTDKAKKVAGFIDSRMLLL